MLRIILIFLLGMTALYSAEKDIPVLGGFRVEEGKLIPLGKNGFKKEGGGCTLQRNYLTMDGLNGNFTVPGSESVKCEDGLTLYLKGRWRTMPGNTELDRRTDAIFFKDKQFAFLKDGERFYLNLHDGKRWSGVLFSGNILPPADEEKFHTFVATYQRHHVVSQGEDWIEVRVWMDGRQVVSKNFQHYKVNRSNFPIEIASGMTFGKCWRFGGDITEAMVIPKVLGPAAIRKLCRAVPEKYVYPAGKKIVLQGKTTQLTLLSAKNMAHPVSFYDKQAKRELLQSTCKMFSLRFKSGSKQYTVSPLTTGMTGKLAGKPVLKNGCWNFSILYTKKATKDTPVTFTAKCDYRYCQDRLEYSLKVSNVANGKIFQAKFPDLTFAALRNGTDYLLVPLMCGILYPNAAETNACYSQTYPRGMASMQLGVYYDNKGGVYVSPADPFGRIKNLNYSVSTESFEAFTAWEVHNGTFDSECYASVESFHGDWFDAAQLYKAEQERIKPVWWRSTLPETDTAKWIRELGWCMSMTFPYIEADSLIKLRKYFEEPFTVSVWLWADDEQGHYTPVMHGSPEFYEFVRKVQAHGVHVIPYTNGRLWSQRGAQGGRGEYDTAGEPCAVVSDGKPFIEYYGGVINAVMCPGTQTYFDRMNHLLKKIYTWGADGVYVDQIGAAASVVCTTDKHDHKSGDLKFWYAGQQKTYAALKKLPIAKNKAISTEDNVETCLRIFDVLEPWRWMYENMVPFFPAVFGGRVQYYGRGTCTNSPYTQTAWMLTNGEQMGKYNHQLLSPLRRDFRRYLKRLIFVRKSMLDFMNCGEMARPPKFLTPVPTAKEYWGVHGDKYITMPKIVSGFWKLGKERALILVNTSGKRISGDLRLELPAGKYKAEIYSSAADPQTKTASPRFHYDLPGQECMVVWFHPANEKNSVREASFAQYFRRIRKTKQETDPFALQLKYYPYKGKLRDPFLWNDLAKTHLIRGAQRSAGGGLDWIGFGLVGAGDMIFDPAAKEFEIEVVAPPQFPAFGTIRFCIDGIEKENSVAEIPFDGTFRTKNLQDWTIRKAKLKKPVSGKHSLYVVFDGMGFCNARNWRMVK